ncbi:Uncharacterized protein APZ42_029989 [Daphnia magna]|uniref:Integrase catalytic domain-containing protein n=1 Tax=Daphnia magna TaxID=35525 RepID=A0A164P5B1_9CRUS|nr:Uncharacterized protein APZ42_029989 [Daphnia magna]
MTILKYLTSTVEGRLSMGEKDGGFGTTGIRADGDFHVVCDTVPDLPTGTVPQHNRLAESNAAERQDYLGINTVLCYYIQAQRGSIFPPFERTIAFFLPKFVASNDPLSTFITLTVKPAVFRLISYFWTRLTSFYFELDSLFRRIKDGKTSLEGSRQSTTRRPVGDQSVFRISPHSFTFFLFLPLCIVMSQLFHCQACEICIANTSSTYRALLHPHEIAEAPFQVIGINFLGPITPVYPKENGYILVIRDYSSRWVKVVTLKHQTAKITADWVFKTTMVRHAMRKAIIFDRGTNFTSKFFHYYCKKIKIGQRLTTAYNPANNGETERFNRTLATILRKELKDGKHPNWEDIFYSLIVVQFTLRHLKPLII